MGQSAATRVRSIADSELQETCATTEQYRDAPFEPKRREGLVYTSCGLWVHSRISRGELLQCCRRDKQASPAEETMSYSTNPPLSIWAWTMYLLDVLKSRISAMATGHSLGAKPQVVCPKKWKFVRTKARAEERQLLGPGGRMSAADVPSSSYRKARQHSGLRSGLRWSGKCAMLLTETGHLGDSVMRSLIRGLAVALFAITFISEGWATEWRVSLWGESRAFTKHVERLAELVAEKTDRQFVLEISYEGSAVSKLDGVISGENFQMAQTCVGYHPKQFRTLSVLELPFWNFSTLEEVRDVSLNLYRHPKVVDAMDELGIGLLMPSPLPQYNLAGVGQVPGSVDELRGLKVRTLGSIGEAVEAIGADSTYTPIDVLNNRLDSGVVNAVSLAPHTLLEYNVLDHSDWWTENLNPGTPNCPVVVNLDAFNKLDAVQREALLSSVDEALMYYIDAYEERITKKWDELLNLHNVKKIKFDENALIEFRDKFAQEWIRTGTANGIPAFEIYCSAFGTLHDNKNCPPA